MKLRLFFAKLSAEMGARAMGFCLAILALAGCGSDPPPVESSAADAGRSLAPEEAFRRMSEALAGAKTVRIRARCEQILRSSSGLEERFMTEGSALLRSDGRARLTLMGTDLQGDQRGVSLDADGSHVLIRLGFILPGQGMPQPRVLGRMIPNLVGRVGLALSALLATERLRIQGSQTDFSGELPVSNFTKGEEDAESASFSCRIADSGGAAIAVKLWYEKKSLRPLRRVVTREEGGRSLSFAETYAEYQIDGGIPDAEFLVPTRRPLVGAGSPASRRSVTDSAGWTILVEKQAGQVTFILIVAPGATVTDDGIVAQVKRGSTTVTLNGNMGLMLSGKGGFSSNPIPEGWNRDLVEEYRVAVGAHPQTTIRQWLQESLQQKPFPFIEQFVQKE